MQKPIDLRQRLNQAFPALAASPEALQLRIKKGSVVTTPAPSLTFEYQYNLLINIVNFSDDIDVLCVTLLSWLQTNQPDLFTRDSAKRRGIRFKTRPNTDGTTHLTVSLRLTERQRVREENQTLHVTYLPEPPPPEPVTRPTALYINGEWVSTWAS